MVVFVALWVAVLGVFTVPVGVFALQVALAVVAKLRGRAGDEVPPEDATSEPLVRVVVLIPAHNEASGIAGTLAGLSGAQGDAFRVVVVADNCTDDTAAVARATGVDVLERQDLVLRGKGHALQHGLNHIRQFQPDALVVVDADCQVNAAALVRLARAAVAHGTPVQCKNLMVAPPDAPVSVKVAAFAWVVKTWVRPLGWTRLGAPCQLMGTGMAFPWAVIEHQNLASSHIVEDLQLTMALAGQGQMASFYPSTRVLSQFPVNAQAVQLQRSRWEHGHLGMLQEGLPPLLAMAWRRQDVRVLALALDIAVPPLSLLILAMVVMCLLAVVTSALTGWWWVAVWALTLAALVCTAVVLAWWHWGRSILSGRELLGVPAYVLSKLGIYKRFVRQRERVWKGTDRE